MANISCIIPFYNEAGRIEKTVNILSHSKYISQIIAVDDGSTDNPTIDIKNQKLPVKYIKNETNLGKSESIYKGLAQTKGNLILLIDADLKDLRVDEIDTACEKMIQNPQVDMLVLKTTQGTLITRICRQDIVLSGARFIKKADLARICALKPYRFQIEVAINTYMVENDKDYFFTRFSGYNTLRSEKTGLIRATIELIRMLYSIYSYRGYFHYIRQLMTFCHRELV